MFELYVSHVFLGECSSVHICNLSVGCFVSPDIRSQLLINTGTLVDVLLKLYLLVCVVSLLCCFEESVEYP